MRSHGQAVREQVNVMYWANMTRKALGKHDMRCTKMQCIALARSMTGRLSPAAVWLTRYVYKCTALLCSCADMIAAGHKLKHKADWSESGMSSVYT